LRPSCSFGLPPGAECDFDVLEYEDLDAKAAAQHEVEGLTFLYRSRGELVFPFSPLMTPTYPFSRSEWLQASGYRTSSAVTSPSPHSRERTRLTIPSDQFPLPRMPILLLATALRHLNLLTKTPLPTLETTSRFRQTPLLPLLVSLIPTPLLLLVFPQPLQNPIRRWTTFKPVASV
jgi:hypothetical protein